MNRRNRIAIAVLAGTLWVAGSLGMRASADVVVAETAVAKAVREHVEASVLLDKGESISVEVIAVPMVPFTLPGEDTLIRTESTITEAKSQRALVRVHVEDETGVARSFGVPVRVSLRRPVLVVTAPVEPGQPVPRSAVRVEEREILYTADHYLAPDANPAKYSARLVLKPGEVLEKRKVQPIPDVRQRDEVRIVLTNNQGMAVSISGVALEDGWVGKTIRVRQNRFRQKDYRGTVTGPRTVQVMI